VGTVFLVLTVLLYLGVQFFLQGEVADLPRNEFEHISSAEATSWTGFESLDNDYFMVANNHFPSFRKKTQLIFDRNTNSQVDFPNSTKLEFVEKSGKNIPSENSGFEFRAANGSEIRAANGSANLSSNPVSITFQSTNIISKTNNPIISGIQSPIPFRTFQSFSNTSSNSFLANNSLSLTTDLSANNSPMLIDGETNPGDPGVPVGDGEFILIGCLLVYGMVLKLKSLMNVSAR